MSIRETLAEEICKLNDTEALHLLEQARMLRANRKTCENCTRIKIGNGCSALKDREYPFEKSGECWAWTDVPDVEKKVKKEAEVYAGHALRG